jgi:microcystin-dependent protein
MPTPPTFVTGTVLTAAQMNLIASMIIPTGSVTTFAGATAPTNWLLCDGSTVSRTTYADLFAVCGTFYNTGGEAGTDFRLPNLKGRVPVGIDTSQSEFNLRGETGGAKTHTLTAAEQATMAVYYGTVTAPLDFYNAAAGGTAGGYVGNIVSSVNNGSARMFAYGGNGAHNNLQPYVAMQYIIKI